MTDSTVSALTAATTLDGAELYYGVQGGGDVKVTGAQIKTLVSASPTLVTPALGTPASGVLTNATGLPIASGVSGLGTGVATALAVNVGTAGAPVVLNGAGGTPSSLTLTNATGLPATGGGTGQSTYTKGDVLASPGSNTLNKLGVGSDGQVLTADAASTNGVKWAAGGGGSPGGSTTQFQYNNSSAFGGTTGFVWDSTNQTITLTPIANTGASAFTITGGTLTGTTSFPAINVTQTWNNSGLTATLIKANATKTSANNSSLLLDLQTGGQSQFAIDYDGGVNIFASVANSISFKLRGTAVVTATTLGVQSSSNTGGFSVGSSADTFLTRPAAATWQSGAADAAAPVAQTARAQSVVAGTTDTAGAAWTRIASKGTGTAAGGNLIEQTGFSAKSTGSSQGTAVDRRIVVAKGKVLTDAAAVSLFEVALPTLTMCGGVIEATVVCTDGTDMQSFTQTVTYSAVNKGGVYTKSITAITGDKSVSAGTIANTWTLLDGTNKVTVQLSSDTSLTPSSNAFMVYYSIKNNSEQATTIL